MQMAAVVAIAFCRDKYCNKNKHRTEMGKVT